LVKRLEANHAPRTRHVGDKIDFERCCHAGNPSGCCWVK
jgi:hypothetical protein